MQYHIQCLFPWERTGTVFSHPVFLLESKFGLCPLLTVITPISYDVLDLFWERNRNRKLEISTALTKA